MIDEGTLAGLLAAHAERIPVPPSAIEALLAASPRHKPTRMRRFARPSTRVLASAAVVVVAAGVVWAVADPMGGESRVALHETRGRAAVPSPPTSSASATERYQAATGAPAGIPPQLAPKNLTATGPSATTSSGDTTAGQRALTDTARVVRTATLDLRIARHGFGETISRINTIAAAAGGFVAEAKTIESAATPSGTVTVRIPSARVNTTVERLRKLGKVLGASTRGVDVTGQYTDLQARLRAATASRDQYLTVLSRATNIGDILAVQDRIQAVQTQIEQLQGQIKDLDDQTTYGTITISVNEPAPKDKAVVGPAHRSGLSIAWDNARDGFARRTEGIISHSGSALVILLGLLLAAGALRLLLPRVRRLLV
jgi:hypothetical protein